MKFTKDTSSDLYQDLYSVGTIGLVEAAQRYNPGKAKFSTYAYIRIKGEILNYLRLKKPLIKIPKTRNTGSDGVSIISLSAQKNDSAQIDIRFDEDEYSFINCLESIRAMVSDREYEIILMKYEGYTRSEISSRLDLTEKKISKIMSQVREKLRPLLGEY